MPESLLSASALVHSWASSQALQLTALVPKIILSTMALAGYFGPSVMRSIFATDGAYQRAFLIALLFDVVGILLTFVYRVVLKKTEGGNH